MPVAKFQPGAAPNAGVNESLESERPPLMFAEPVPAATAPKQLEVPPQFTVMSPCVTLWKMHGLPLVSPALESHVPDPMAASL